MKISVSLLAFLFLYQSASAVVIRGESRKQVLSPKEAKAKKVGLLEAWNNDTPDSKSYCTASNVSKRHLITAAHCVVDIRTGKLFDNVVYYPRHVNLRTRSPSRVFIRKAYLLKNYLKENKKLVFDGSSSIYSITKPMIENDIALLEAYSDKNQDYVGKLYGWFGYKPAPQSIYSGNILDVSMRSYPGDKDRGSLWYEECYLMHVQGNVAKTSCDVWPGASGSAITMKIADSNYWQVIGVASAESQRDRVNKVALLTESLTSEIGKIVSGKTNELKQFKKVYLNTEKFYYFHLENLCYKDVKVAFRIQLPEGKWATYEDYHIGKNQKSLSLPSSKNAIYYYFAKAHSGSDFWGDQVNGVEKFAFGEYRWFFKREVPDKGGPERWGDYYRQISCD